MREIVNKIRLTGKTAVVTGGHSGIGRGIVEAFAQAGASNILIAGRREELGNRAAAEVAGEHGVNCAFYRADITAAADREALIGEAVSRFGRIDILVNNAGITHVENAEDISWESWRRVMDVNLDSLFFLSQAAGRVMIKQKGGCIINVSSNSDRLVMTPQRQTVYNASKAAVSMMTKCLAYEWAEHNIRVNAVSPGYIQSDILPEGVSKDGKKFRDVWTGMIPMGRFGYAEEVGAIVLFAASDICPFLNGSVILADGGYHLT
ncbi:MAG: glucose 1-dehydrogenase [Treponema sp.]|jgi:NAD(P)-dependent dehydrogenase (short-subunit alcohol dehydrogenase family)|nr:glucose 1-dehydrogenase [Treponema sp.]